MQPLPRPPWSPLGCSSWLLPCFSPHTPTWPWTERLGIMFPVYSWSWRTLSRVNCLLSPWWNGCTRVAQSSVNCLDGCKKYLQQMPSCLSVRTLFIHSNNWTGIKGLVYFLTNPEACCRLGFGKLLLIRLILIVNKNITNSVQVLHFAFHTTANYHRRAFAETLPLCFTSYIFNDQLIVQKWLHSATSSYILWHFAPKP